MLALLEALRFINGLDSFMSIVGLGIEFLRLSNEALQLVTSCQPLCEGIHEVGGVNELRSRIASVHLANEVLLDRLGIEKAHFVGLSMGAFTGLMMCLQHPDRMLSLVAASGGSGAFPAGRDQFINKCMTLADAAMAADLMPADHMAYGHNRIQLREKNYAAWLTFYEQLSEHPGIGAGLTQKMVQACLLYTSPTPRDLSTSRMPSSA